MARQTSLDTRPQGVEPSEDPYPSETADESRHDGEVMGRRHRFVIDGSRQLRSGLIITGMALVLVVLVNLSLHGARVQASEQVAAVSPQLATILDAHNRLELFLGLGASFVLLVGIFVVAILETHKTAGAAYHLSRKLEQIRGGSYGSTLRLRTGDNLRGVEEAFNSMSRGLAERLRTDIEELEHAASWADRVSSPKEARELANRLRELADERRRTMPDPTSPARSASPSE